MDIWQRVFDDPIPWSRVGASAATLGGFSFGFALIAWLIFRRKDILS
jgi:hypothetical protein